MTYTVQNIDNSIAYTSPGARQCPRKIDRTSNGVLWTAIWTSSNIAFYSSTNNGQTWTWAGAQSQIFDGQITDASAFSFHIDSNDYLHLAYGRYLGSPDSRTTRTVPTYRRATLNAGKDAISGWQAAQAFAGSDYWNSYDIVSVTMPGTNITYVHIATSYNWSGDNRQIVVYQRYRWTGETFSSDGLWFLHDVVGGGTQHCWPSIDFRHSGDGKTPKVVGGQNKPDVWITYQLSTKQYAYTIDYDTGSNSYTPVSTHMLSSVYSNFGDTTGGLNYPIYEHHRWARTMYDPVSDKVIVVGDLISSDFSQSGIFLFERNADLANISNWTSYAVISFNGQLLGGDACLLDDGDIAIGGRSFDNSLYVQFGIIKRNTSSRTYQFLHFLESGVGDWPQGTMMPYPHDNVRFMYHIGTANPYPIRLSHINMSNVYVKTASDVIQTKRAVVGTGINSYRRVRVQT